MLGNTTIQLAPYDCAIYHNAALALTTLADFALSQSPWVERTNLALGDLASLAKLG